MKKRNKLILAIVAGIAFLAVVVMSVLNIFSSGNSQMMNGATAMNQSFDTIEGENGERIYQTYTLTKQEAVSLNGTAQLHSDNSYYYNAEQGDIEMIYVKDGQVVKKGDTLFAYYLDKNKHDVEDTLREQTRLYNQREELIAQLSRETGYLYNYQGDAIATYWGDDGKQQYYVIESIGKSNDAPTPSQDAEQGQATDGSSDGIKSQIRQINRQIEDVEIKLIRLKEQQHGKVTAKFGGKVVLDEAGRDNDQVPLVRIISDEISVTGSVTEYEFYALGENRAVNLFVNAEERNVAGKMVEYDHIPAAQGRSGSGQGQVATPSSEGQSGVRYRFTVAPESFIQPGFSVKVQVFLPGLVIPNEAILEEMDKTFVFVNDSGIARKKEVKLERQGLQKVVLTGLKEGEELLLNPFDLKDGQEVQVGNLDMGEFVEGVKP